MILNVQNISKQYKDGNFANKDISFSVEEGEIFGLLGPSGAGKTTLINQIMGLIQPTSGTIEISGKNIVKNPSYARKYCSFAPQTYAPVNGMTPIQAIEILGRIRGGNKKEVIKNGKEMLEYLEMSDWMNKPCESLSGGLKRLVTFAIATACPGNLIVLDEPTNDVYQMRRKLLWNKIRELSNNGKTVLLITHNVLEAEKAVDKLAIIDKGKLIANGSPAQLKEYSEGYLVLDLYINCEEKELNLPNYMQITLNEKKRMRLLFKQEQLVDISEWLFLLKKEKKVDEYSIGAVSLEDVYLHMTKKD